MAARAGRTEARADPNLVCIEVLHTAIGRRWPAAARPQADQAEGGQGEANVRLTHSVSLDP